VFEYDFPLTLKSFPVAVPLELRVKVRSMCVASSSNCFALPGFRKLAVVSGKIVRLRHTGLPAALAYSITIPMAAA
jgi:hypothetical protein